MRLGIHRDTAISDILNFDSMNTIAADPEGGASKSNVVVNVDGTAKATIAWKSLSVLAKDAKGNDRKLLDSISGGLEPNGMLAIM